MTELEKKIAEAFEKFASQAAEARRTFPFDDPFRIEGKVLFKAGFEAAMEERQLMERRYEELHPAITKITGWANFKAWVYREIEKI